jgi:predicted NACHT family NTPase
MDKETREENEHFENEVRRIARALWPSSSYAGAIMLDGREADGVFATEECIHIVEATTSRRKEKARNDLNKIAKMAKKLAIRNRNRVIRGWFITRDEPTAEQRSLKIGRDTNINLLSFVQFQSHLIDSGEYLSARENYAFGSVRDPETGDISPSIEYVPLDIVRLDSTDLVSHDELAQLVTNNNVIVLLGDYGAGKSMTLREVYRNLRQIHIRSKMTHFPVYLNLRDHYGQTDPGEILSRHARTIGFVPEHHLVRAWRAGHVHLLIDGFDEVAGVSIQGEWRRLQSNRYQAMSPVRRLVNEHPRNAGLLIAGR